MNLALIKSLLRHLLGAALTALAAVQWADAELTWKVLAGTVGAACVPVIVKYLDAGEQDYGRARDETGEGELTMFLRVATFLGVVLLCLGWLPRP